MGKEQNILKIIYQHHLLSAKERIDINNLLSSFEVSGIKKCR